MKTDVYRTKDGGVVLTAASEHRVLATVQWTRAEALEVRERLDAKLARGVAADWEETATADEPDDQLATAMRHQILGLFDGAEVRLGSLDSVRAIGRWDERTARILHKQLGKHLERLASGLLVSLEEEAKQDAKKAAEAAEAAKIAKAADCVVTTGVTTG